MARSRSGNEGEARGRRHTSTFASGASILRLRQPATTLGPATPWQEVVPAYLEAAVSSPETRRAYSRHLRSAFAGLGVPTVADIDDAALRRWRSAVLRSGRSWAVQTQALSALRSFLRWSADVGAHGLSGAVTDAALKAPRHADPRIPAALTEREVARLLAAADTPRDRALLALLVGAGLRVGELVALDVSDVAEEREGGSVLRVRGTGGGHVRTVPIRPDVARLLHEHLSTGHANRGREPLFRAHDRASAALPRGRLTARAVRDVVARCAGRAGVRDKQASPHTLRHTFAIRALRSGGELVVVSRLLGHASVSTTERYLDRQHAVNELRQAMPLLPTEPLRRPGRSGEPRVRRNDG